MGEHGAICRLGVFYDGSFFSYAQHYYYHERKLGWLRFPELHHFLEKYIGLREQGFASYKVPLVRALNKQGVRALAAYFAFEKEDGGKSFINERLLAAANYAVDIAALESSKEHKQDFATLFRKA